MKKLALLLFCAASLFAQEGTPVKGLFGAGPPNANLAHVVGTQYIDTTTNVLYFCSAVTLTATVSSCTWTAGGGVSPTPKNIIDVTAAPYSVSFDAKWATGLNVTFSTAQTNCNGTTVPAGTCITTATIIPAFVSTDVGKYATGFSNCPQSNPPTCTTRFLTSTTIVAVIDTHHAQVGAAVSVSSNANGANFYWGTGSGQITTGLQTALNALGDAVATATAIQFPCPTSPFSGGLIVDANFSIPTHAASIGLYGCPGGGSIFILRTDMPNATTNATIFAANGAIGQSITQYGMGDSIENLFFWGAGAPVNVGFNPGNSIISFAGGPMQVRNVALIGFWWNVTSAFVLNGISVSGFNTSLKNVSSFAGGNYNCKIAGTGGGSISWDGGICGAAVGNGMTIGGQVSVLVTNCYCYAQNAATDVTYGVVVDNTGQTTLTGNVLYGVIVQGSSNVLITGNDIYPPFSTPGNPSLSMRGGNLSLGSNAWAGFAGGSWLSQSGGSIIDLANEAGTSADVNVPTITGGSYSQIPITICSNVTPVTVNANVATDQLLMACTIPAGVLNFPGRILEVWLADVYTTPAASVATLNTKIKLCTVSGCGSGTVINLANITSSANPGTVTNNSINVFDRATTQTVGASAAFETHGNMVIDLGATPGVADTTFSDSTTATVGTIDAGLQLFLQVTGAFSVANASNSRTERQLIVRTLN